MKKSFLLPSLLLFALGLMSAGCDKPESGVKENNPVQELPVEEKTPPKETMMQTEEAEMIDEKGKSETKGDTAKIDDQEYEGSKTLKRYIEE